jgi:hypothetical protein
LTAPWTGLRPTQARLGASPSLVEELENDDGSLRRSQAGVGIELRVD